MNNRTIFITGYPGVGKETVTDAICALTGAKKIGGSDLSASFFRAVGYPPGDIPDEVLQLAFNEMHRTFLGQFGIAKLAPRGTNHIFTNWLTDDENGRAETLMGNLYDLAQHKGSPLISIVLICSDMVELKARVMDERRAEQFKLTDPQKAQQIFDAPLYIPPNAQVIDTAGKTSEKVAQIIIQYANQPSSSLASNYDFN